MNNVIEHRLPNHPMYALEHKRLSTFEDWPPGMPIKPEILAEAGFFYLGKSVKITNRSPAIFNIYYTIKH